MDSLTTTGTLQRGKVNTFLVVDEFQRFLGPDIYDFLPVLRQMGVHLFLAHQSLSQLEKGDIDMRPLIGQARSRMVFANDFEDADLLAEEFANFTWDPNKIKHQVQTFRQRLVGNRIEILRGGSSTDSTTDTQSRQSKRAKGTSQSRSPEQDLPTRGESDQISWADVTGGSTAHAVGENWKEQLVPIHEDFLETTSVQFQPREEIVHDWRKKLRELGTGNCYFKQVSDSTLYRLKIRYLSTEDEPGIDEAVEELLEKNYQDGPFISNAEADRNIEKLRDELKQGPIERLSSDQTAESEQAKRHGSIFDD